MAETYSAAKIAAIFKAAEDVLYDADKNHDLTDEDLAVNIVVQSRFIIASDPPSIPPGTKEIARRVIEIADGPEPSWQDIEIVPVGATPLPESDNGTETLEPFFAEVDSALASSEMESFTLDGYLFTTHVRFHDGTPGPLVAEIVESAQEAHNIIEHGVGGDDALWLADEIQKRIAGDMETGYMGRVKITVEYEKWIEE